MAIRPDRDPSNPNAIIDLDDLKGELKTFPQPVAKDKLISALKQFNLIDILTAIRQATVWLFRENRQYDDTYLLTYSRLNYFATLALLYSPAESGKKLSRQAFQTLTLMVNRYDVEPLASSTTE